MPEENTINLILSHFFGTKPERGHLLQRGCNFSELQLDSLEVVRFLAFLQKSFHIRIQASEYLDGKFFLNLLSIAEFVEQKRHAK